VSPDCHLFARYVRYVKIRAKVESSMARLHLVNRATLPLHADLLIAGAHCALATNSEEILACVNRWRCSGPPPSRTAFEMNVVLDRSLPRQRDIKTQTHFRGLHHLVFATIGEHEVFTFDLLRKQVVGAVSQASAEDHSFWNSHWLPITIGVMGTTVGVVPVHSACLELDGKGLLIAGVSGAGKSTLSLALAQSGCSLISDDWTYITREGDTLLAHGIGAPVKLLPDTVKYFPELAGRTPKMWFNGELAFEVDTAEFCRQRMTLGSRPYWLLFLERTSAPGCTFAPCTADQARRFFENGAERLPDQVPQASVARSEMIRSISNCACWHVRSGDTPQQTAEAVRRFCERN
jgi:HPr Serine kinase C-terminal domain